MALSFMPVRVVHKANLIYVVLRLSQGALPVRSVDAFETRDDNDTGLAREVAQGFAALLPYYSGLEYLMVRPWNFGTRSVRGHLLTRFPPTSFSSLTSLFIASAPGRPTAALTILENFELLAIMPSLKKLQFNKIYPLGESESEERLPAPACHLDVGASTFLHYTLLLSRSHDSLRCMQVCYSSVPAVGDDLRRALAPCTRLRHLTLMGNSFDHAAVISACPRVSSLSLTAAPACEQMAALRGPLRVLQLSHSFTRATAESYVDTAWSRLQDTIMSGSRLTELRFVFFRRTLQHETEGYREMCRVCTERGIQLHLSVHPDYD